MFLGTDLAVKHNLKQKVTELADQLVVIAFVDGLNDLISFFEHHRFKGVVSLFTIPRASAGCTEPRDQLDELREFVS